MSKLFTVTHKDGTPWEKKELIDYATPYPGMAWDSLDGFAIDEDGNVYLMDRCGHYVVAPDDCELVMHERTCHVVEYHDYGEYLNYELSCGHGEDAMEYGYVPCYCPVCGAKVVDE